MDDTPFGGGAGMVLRPDVIDAALHLVADGRPILCLTPRGRRFTQADAARLAGGDGVILLCGRYEGIDQRVIEARDMEEISVGDYVLSGGEPAGAGLAGCHHPPAAGRDGRRGQCRRGKLFRTACWNTRTTRGPRNGAAAACRTSLLSGHHGAVAAWRRAEAERITKERRPDLWAAHIAGSAPVSAPVMTKGRLP